MSTNQKKTFQTVHEYLAEVPVPQRKKLQELRALVKKLVPEAEEVISYNMPAFKYNGILLYFAAHKNHIGFYPGNSSALEIFSGEAAAFKTSKGTLQLPNDDDLPVTLLKKIIQLRAEQNLKKTK